MYTNIDGILNKQLKFSEDPPQTKSHYSTEDVTSDNEDQSTGQ